MARVYIRAMRTLLLLLSAFAASPALAGASNFTLVNGTDANLSELSIRRAGTTEWKALPAAPAPGARGPVKFSDPDCAFDLKATVPGKGPVTWGGVNLCDVKSVTLKHGSASGPWVDYDQ
jgi:hypothetical protein